MVDPESHSAPFQIGIRAALALTAGIAIFAASSRLLIETGVHPVVVLIVMVPGTVGSFYGLVFTKTGRRSALIGSLLGCIICLLPTVAYLLLMTIAGILQSSVELTTVAGLGLFSTALCLCVSGLAGGAFAIAHGVG